MSQGRQPGHTYNTVVVGGGPSALAIALAADRKQNSLDTLLNRDGGVAWVAPQPNLADRGGDTISNITFGDTNTPASDLLKLFPPGGRIHSRLKGTTAMRDLEALIKANGADPTLGGTPAPFSLVKELYQLIGAQLTAAMAGTPSHAIEGVATALVHGDEVSTVKLENGDQVLARHVILANGLTERGAGINPALGPHSGKTITSGEVLTARGLGRFSALIGQGKSKIVFIIGSGQSAVLAARALCKASAFNSLLEGCTIICVHKPFDVVEPIKPTHSPDIQCPDLGVTNCARGLRGEELAFYLGAMPLSSSPDYRSYHELNIKKIWMGTDLTPGCSRAEEVRYYAAKQNGGIRLFFCPVRNNVIPSELRLKGYYGNETPLDTWNLENAALIVTAFGYVAPEIPVMTGDHTVIGPMRNQRGFVVGSEMGLLRTQSGVFIPRTYGVGPAYGGRPDNSNNLGHISLGEQRSPVAMPSLRRNRGVANQIVDGIMQW